MAQPERASATKTDDLSVVPGTQMVGRADSELSLACTGALHQAHAHAHGHTKHVIECNNLKGFFLHSKENI